MKSKILLVNFSYAEQEKVAKLGVDVDLGFLSNAWNLSGSHSEGEAPPQAASFYSPLAIYEYKVVIIRLTKNPQLATTYSAKAKVIDDRDRTNFFSYWYEGRGILIMISDNSDFFNLNVLGIPLAYLEDSTGNDATIEGYSSEQTQELKKTLQELKSTIAIPPAKYVLVPRRESDYNARKRWTIYTAYSNRNDDRIGIYLNWGASYENEERPAFLILPAFKDYIEVIRKLLISFSKIYKNFIPEIYEADWVDSDKYYPKEVVYFNEQTSQTIEAAKKKIEELEKAKSEAKQKYSFIRSILHTSGDELKDSVIRVLREIWKLDITDMDETRKNDFKEDILIKNNGPIILGEIKGTQNQNPSFTYITQLLTHLLKSDHRQATGALILNYDLNKEPHERNKAYTKEDEQDQLKEIIFVDTRSLFNLTIAILDHGLDIEEAKKILLSKGRVDFDLDEYVKSKVEQAAIPTD